MSTPGKDNRRRLTVAFTLIVVLTWLLPIFWLINVSLKTQKQLFVATPTFVFEPTFENFGIAISQYGILWNALHSFIIAGGTTVITLFLALVFIYGVTRFRFRFRNPLLMWILNLRMSAHRHRYPLLHRVHVISA